MHMFALMLNPKGLHFEIFYIYSKSLNQPNYEFLNTLSNNVEGVGYFPYNDHETVISSNDAKKIAFTTLHSPNSVRQFFLTEIIG